MKISMFLSGALMSVLLSCGCSKPAGEEFFPDIKSGDMKAYNVTLVMPLQGVQKGRLSWRVDGTEVINGKKYFKEVFATGGLPGFGAHIGYTRKDKTGIYWISDKDASKTEFLLLPFPVQVGSEWTADKHDGKEYCKVVAREPLYLVDRKYDDCLKIVSTNDQFESTVWYAKDVGYVKSILETEDATMETELDQK